MSDRTQKQASAKAAWVTFSIDTRLICMLASVYSYCVMVKSISSCCVHGIRVISNSVTYTHARTHARTHTHTLTHIYLYVCMYICMYTMVTSYIKGTDRYIYTHSQVGMYHIHLASIILIWKMFHFNYVTMCPLVETVICKVTKFLAKMTFILFTGIYLSICTPTTNPSGSLDTDFSFCTVTIVFHCEE